MNRITIIGFGRFGKTLHRLLKHDFDVLVYTRRTVLDKSINQTHSLKEAYNNTTVMYAVPIAAFEKVIADHKEYVTDDHLLIDVLSVKMHPKAVFEKHFKGTKVQCLLTHPMFGPDSSADGFEGLPIAIDKFRTHEKAYTFWKSFFSKKKLQVIEMTAKEHDELAANSQGLTHFIGRLLDEFGLKETPIDTIGARKLAEIREQTCNDTWDLFTNLQQYNPYTKEMRLKLGDAYDNLYNKLIPQKVSPDHVTIGIQGGPGSFNEEAILYNLKRNNITKYEIVYLHTSENVLRALHEGSIDQGQFAIHNSVGGMVTESVQAMAKYKFAIVEEYAIKIAHALMIKKGTTFHHIDTIMTHPQVLAQCKETLFQKYPNLKQTSGEGELIDHALVAEGLSRGTIPSNIATMGSKVLAKLYDLHIVEDNLQDLKENYTSFLLVKRI